MAVNNRQNIAYSQNQPLSNIFPSPVVANRAPTTADKYPIGQSWIYSTNNAPYVLTSIVNNSATWQLLESSGGTGVFTSLTVTGTTTLTGTTNINTTGAATTDIGTGGTGAVNIGNATGNTAVTGTLTTSAGITATTGNIVLSAATAAFVTGGGAYVISGSGAPTSVSAPQGSLYLNLTGSSTSTRAYINTNGTTGWTAITTAA